MPDTVNVGVVDPTTTKTKLPKPMRVDKITLTCKGETDILFSSVMPGVCEAGIIHLQKLASDFGSDLRIELKQLDPFIEKELSLYDDILRYIRPTDLMYEKDGEWKLVGSMMSRIASEAMVNKLYRLALQDYCKDPNAEDGHLRELFFSKLEGLLEILA